MGNHFHITDNFAVRGCQPNESKLKPIEVLTSQVHTGNLVRFLRKICYNHDIMTVQLDFLRKLGFLRILEDSCDSILQISPASTAVLPVVGLCRVSEVSHGERHSRVRHLCRCASVHPTILRCSNFEVCVQSGHQRMFAGLAWKHQNTVLHACGGNQSWNQIIFLELLSLEVLRR